jgi:hypothetical protein
VNGKMQEKGVLGRGIIRIAKEYNYGKRCMM